jgi:ribosomal protein L20A (L18A)
MLKISLCILAVYLIYYAGNIAYDLFLKKEKEIYKEEADEFSLSEISGQYQDSAKNIRIEDVENINTPKSFSKNQILSESIEGKDERQDLEYLREQFESEQDLDEPDNPSITESTENENQPYLEKTDFNEDYLEQNEKILSERESPELNEVTQQSQISIDIGKENSRVKEWKKMLNLSETMVQLVANQNGYKIYHSIM